MGPAVAQGLRREIARAIERQAALPGRPLHPGRVRLGTGVQPVTRARKDHHKTGQFDEAVHWPGGQDNPAWRGDVVTIRRLSLNSDPRAWIVQFPAAHLSDKVRDEGLAAWAKVEAAIRVQARAPLP